MDRTSTKQIAKEIKEAVKSLKGVKVSVTTDYNHISVALISAPFAPVVKNEIVHRGYMSYDNNAKPFDGRYGVNQYSFTEDSNLTVEAKGLFEVVETIIKKYHWDKSDSMTDYFNCAFYYDYQVGRWDKPFIQK
ncbi:MAG TPA: hypothetical protein VK658_08725 [Chryseolinea sp.]|nr:hypothetical protein [Chryseolinea sp.]